MGVGGEVVLQMLNNGQRRTNVGQQLTVNTGHTLGQTRSTHTGLCSVNVNSLLETQQGEFQLDVQLQRTVSPPVDVEAVQRRNHVITVGPVRPVLSWS